MKFEELEKVLKDEKLSSIYVLYGEETYLLDLSIKKIKKLFGEKVIRNQLYWTWWTKYQKSDTGDSNAKLWIL